MQVYIAILFSIAAIATVVLQFWPKTTLRDEQPFMFPLLTMAAIDMVALLAPQPVNVIYKGMILLGLMLSTLAVIFYYMPKTPTYVAAAHFLIIYFLYFLGFSSANKVAVPSPIVLLLLAYCALIFWYTKEQVKEQWGALLGYIIMMFLMIWSASEVWGQHTTQTWATIAFAGALLLVISNSILLVDRTRTPVKWSNIIVAATFFLGQIFIAWSIWGFDIPNA